MRIGWCLLAGWALVWATACGEQELDCAAVVRYDGPILTIDSTTGPDGRPAESVRLTRIREGGHRFYGPGNEDFGLKAGPGRSVVCRAPCGLGTEAGTISFIDASSGRTHRFEVSYAGSRPGCGGALYGGTHVDLRLEG